MLTVLRKLSETWIFKGILALTALSFISLFGVGSLSILKKEDNIAVKTKGFELANEDFLMGFSKDIAKLNKMTNGNLSLKEAINKGMYVPLIMNKAYEMTMMSMYKDLNIDISPVNLGQVIRSQPMFINQFGDFSKEQYNYYLSSIGVSPYEFETNMARDIKNRFVSEPLKETLKVPELLLKASYEYQNEKRNGSYFEISVNDMVIKEKPSQEDLKSYYEGYEENFMAPEYREVTAMYVPYDEIKNDIKISNEELSQRYEELKSSFSIPEKREILQILVQDEALANKIVKEAKSKKDFVKIAKDLAGQSKEDTELGFVTSDSLIVEISDVAFDAKKGEVVGPIKSDLGYHIVKINEVISGKVYSLEDKKEEIEKALKNEKMADVIVELLDKIDDAFGLGKTLEETANIVNAKLIKLDAIDISGIKKDGNVIKSDAVNDEFIRNVFEGGMEVGQVSVTIEGDKGLSVFRLDNVEPPKVKEFSEVKLELYKKWEKDKKEEMLDKAYNDLSNDVKTKKSLENLAKKYGLKTQKISKVGRVVNDDVSLEVVNALFNIENIGQILSSKSKDGYVFVSLSKIASADKTNEDVGINQIKDDLQNEISESLYSEFVNVLGEKYGLKINNKSIEKALEIYKTQASY